MVLDGFKLYCVGLNCIKWYYIVLDGMAWYGKVQYGDDRCWRGMGWYSMVLNGMRWFGMV